MEVKGYRSANLSSHVTGPCKGRLYALTGTHQYSPSVHTHPHTHPRTHPYSLWTSLPILPSHQDHSLRLLPPSLWLVLHLVKMMQCLKSGPGLTRHLRVLRSTPGITRAR